MITKPRNQWKPRSQWKKRARGRVTVDIGDALFIFEMTTKGVSVRKKRSRLAGAKVWRFEQLANGVGAKGQMALI